MKNRTTLFILLFLTGITFLFFLLNLQSKMDKNQKQSEESEMKKSFNSMLEELNNTFANAVIQNIILEDMFLKEFPISDLAFRKPILFFRFSEFNCSSCYEKELFSLQHYFSKEYPKIAILSSYASRRQYVMFIKANRIELPFYRIPQDAFDWKLEDYGSPYYFVLHPDLTVSHIYIPDTTFPELNKQYLESVKKYLTE